MLKKSILGGVLALAATGLVITLTFRPASDTATDAVQQPVSGQAPTWRHYAIKAFPLCSLMQTADYFVQATPISIGPPYLLELSPWPGEKSWVTPVEWALTRTLQVNPLPGVQLPVLGSKFTTVVAADFKDTSERVLTMTAVDGRLLTDEFGFTFSGQAWNSRLVVETFASITDIESALKVAAATPECGRVDVLGVSRVANEKARLAAPTWEPNPPRPSGP